MGNRSQIAIKQDNNQRIYLYSHWDGDSVYVALRNALIRGRWRDSEYLARIIFQDMIGNDKGTTGYGISTSMHGDIEHPLPVLDCSTNTISWEGPRSSNLETESFDAFIARTS